MSLRDRSDCTSIAIRGFAMPASDRAQITVVLNRRGPSVLQAFDVEEITGDCELGDLLALLER